MHACMAELGISLTKEPGFHQVCYLPFQLSPFFLGMSVAFYIVSDTISGRKKLQPFGSEAGFDVHMTFLVETPVAKKEDHALDITDRLVGSLLDLMDILSTCAL